MASLYIKDGDVFAMATELAERRQMTKTDAVRIALAHELERDQPMRTAREKLEDFYRRHPLPEPTGRKADKAFYDDLSGNL